MTNEEAINRLRKRMCYGCTDACIREFDECEISLAIATLKLRSPRKIYMEKMGDTTTYYCPICDVEVYQMGRTHIRRAVLIPEKPKYCYNCGQRFDWEDNNE